MGIIIKESVKGAIISYLGVLIGAINLIFLMPFVLNTSEIGLIRSIIDSAFILSTYAKFAIPNTSIKFFSYFKNKKRYNGFLGIIISSLIIGITLIIIISIILKPYLISEFSENAPLFENYFYHILTLMSLYTMIYGISVYPNLLFKITVSKFVIEILIRIGITIPLILYFFDLIVFSNIINSLIIILFIGIIILLFYIQLQGKLFLKYKLRDIDNSLLKSIKTYISYMFIGSAGAIIISRIDTIMITSIKGLADTGIYSIAFFIGALVELPKRSLSTISSPIIAHNFKNNLINEIEIVYKKSSLNLFLIGGIFFLLIWLNIDNIFKMIPNSESYLSGKNVVFFIAIAKLIDMSMGTNGDIISNSNFYKWNVFITLFFAVIIVLSNLYFIPIYGMIGASIATLISIIIYNLIRFVLIKVKLNIQPFSFDTLKVLFILSVTYIVGYYDISKTSVIFLNICIKSIQIIIPFILLVLIIKPSLDIEEQINKYKEKYFGSKN